MNSDAKRDYDEAKAAIWDAYREEEFTARRAYNKADELAAARRDAALAEINKQEGSDVHTEA